MISSHVLEILVKTILQCKHTHTVLLNLYIIVSCIVHFASREKQNFVRQLCDFKIGNKNFKTINKVRLFLMKSESIKVITFSPGHYFTIKDID